MQTQTDVYQLNVLAPDRFFFSLSQQGGTQFLSLRLIDPAGQQVFVGFAGDNFTPVLTLPGTYHVLVEGAIAEAGTTPYVLQAFPDFSGSPQDIVHAVFNGDTVSGRIFFPLLESSYRFLLNTLGSFFFDFNSDLQQPGVTLVDSHGIEHALDLSKDHTILQLEAGPYLLKVADGGGGTGNFLFNLWSLTPAANNALVIPLGLSVPSSFTLGKAKLYQVNAQAGDVFNLTSTLVSGTTQPTVELIDPLGRARPITDSFTRSGSTITLPVAGTHVLAVHSPFGSGDAQVRLLAQITRNVPVGLPPTDIPLTLNATTNGNFNAAGDTASYRFSLANSATLVFAPLSNRPDLAWQLRDPTDFYSVGGTFASLATNPVLNLAAGQYQLTLTAEAGGPYAFALLDVAGAPTDLTVGTPLHASLSPANGTN